MLFMAATYFECVSRLLLSYKPLVVSKGQIRLLLTSGRQRGNLKSRPIETLGAVSSCTAPVCSFANPVGFRHAATPATIVPERRSVYCRTLLTPPLDFLEIRKYSAHCEPQAQPPAPRLDQCFLPGRTRFWRFSLRSLNRFCATLLKHGERPLQLITGVPVRTRS